MIAFISSSVMRLACWRPSARVAASTSFWSASAPTPSRLREKLVLLPWLSRGARQRGSVLPVVLPIRTGVGTDGSAFRADHSRPDRRNRDVIAPEVGGDHYLVVARVALNGE